MAIYQGARQRSDFALPAVLRPALRPGLLPRLGAPAIPRTSHGHRSARARTAVIRPGASRVGMILATIVVVFSGAFLWLTQSVRVAATNYDIVRMVSERDRLDALRVDLRSDLERLA